MCITCAEKGSLSDEHHHVQVVNTPLDKALDDPGIQQAFVEFQNGQDMIKAFLARQTGNQRRPAVILTHGNWELPEDMRNAAAQIAQAGYIALLLDPTSRYPDLSILSRDFLMSDGYIKLLLSDIESGMAYLKTQPFVQDRGFGLMGFCGGGILNLMFAALHPDEVRAVVTFYAAPYVGRGNNSVTDPRPDMITFVPQIKCPIQCHFGTQDVVIPVADIDTFEEEVRRHSIQAEIYRYEGAKHGFYHYLDGDSYDAAASQFAQQRMITFLKTHFPSS